MSPLESPHTPPACLWQVPSPGYSKEAEYILRGLQVVHGLARHTARDVQLSSALRLLERAAAAPGWDGHGALPVQLLAVRKADLLVASLPWNVPCPSVTADPDGEVSLDWDAGRDALFGVSVRADGRLAWAGRLGDERVTGIGFLKTGVPAVVIEWAGRVGDRLIASDAA